jgi:osmotically-inducible protein OsmY
MADKSSLVAEPAAVRNPPPKEESIEQRRRIMRIKRVIRRHTSGGIRELAVELETGSVRLRGQCNSFYCKQMAQQAAMNFLPGETIVNEIEVAALPR